MVHTASQHHNVPLGPMVHSPLCQAAAKQSVLTSLLQHGLHAVQLCAIHPRQASIVQTTTSVRPGTATFKLSRLFPRLAKDTVFPSYHRLAQENGLDAQALKPATIQALTSMPA